jgi:hypothetical protein
VTRDPIRRPWLAFGFTLIAAGALSLVHTCSCARVPTRVRIQELADQALAEEQERAEAAEACATAQQAARVARHGSDRELARLVGEAAAKLCGTWDPTEVWP